MGKNFNKNKNSSKICVEKNRKKMSKERLEPTGQSILNIVGGQNTALTKPKIGDFKVSDTLSRVKDFLQTKKPNSELTEKDNLEDVSKDSKYVEMNIEKYTTNPDCWSADSDPDSTPSPPERDNAYTSDSDSSSDSSDSSTSDSNQDSKFKLKLPSENNVKTKPNIEELN